MNALLVILICVGFLPPIFIVMENNYYFVFVVYFFLLPICYFVFVSFRDKKYFFAKTGDSWRDYFYSIGTTFLFLLSSSGYVILLNCYLGEQKLVQYEGKVVELEKYVGNRGGISHHLVFVDIADNKKKSVKINYLEYERLEEGCLYKKMWWEGSLGLRYLKTGGEGVGFILSDEAISGDPCKMNVR